MELPRELWEGQNMKVVTHTRVDIDVDRCIQSSYGGINPLQSESTQISSNVSYFMLNVIVSSS